MITKNIFWKKRKIYNQKNEKEIGVKGFKRSSRKFEFSWWEKLLLSDELSKRWYLTVNKNWDNTVLGGEALFISQKKINASKNQCERVLTQWVFPYYLISAIICISVIKKFLKFE